MTATRDDLALLALRLVLGATFIVGGLGRFGHGLSWSDALAAAEVAAGTAVLVGAFTRCAGFAIAVDMAVVIFFHLVPHGAPFVSNSARVTFGLPLTDLAIGFALVVLGPGALSIDARRSGTRRPPPARRNRGPGNIR